MWTEHQTGLRIDLTFGRYTADALSTKPADPQTDNVPLSDPCHPKLMGTQSPSEIEPGDLHTLLILSHDEQLLV
jgi:hypothetical protein